MTYPDLTNIVWIKSILTDMNILNSYRHIRPKKVKYPIPEIPDDSGKKSGTDWVLPKIIGSGIGYPSGTACNLLGTMYISIGWLNAIAQSDIRLHGLIILPQYVPYSDHNLRLSVCSTLKCVFRAETFVPE